jgi:HAD superfamily hydrolase (TIGR01509 family)
MTHLKAIIFGAIGVIAETSDLQRQSFNVAFAQAGLDWDWDPETYRELLLINGGQNRLRSYRDNHPQTMPISDALIAELHERKTAAYAKMMEDGSLKPRAGVSSLMASCKAAGVLTALCTSTSRSNVDAIALGLGSQLNFGDFVSVITINKIAAAKPAPDAYLRCLSELGLGAQEVVAVEDTPVSMASARAAHIKVIATPGTMTADQDFSGAALVVPDLTSVTVASISKLLDLDKRQA